MYPQTTLEILLARHNGALRLPLATALAAISMPLQTARNKMVAGVFAIPTHLVGSRRFVLTADIAAHIDGATAPPPLSEPPVFKFTAGNPSKAAQAAAKAAGHLKPSGRADVSAHRAALRTSKEGQK